jgi:hypothetical protein
MGQWAMTDGRIPCAVPFCRRTAPREKFPDASEIMCGRCWRRARRSRRLLFARLRRRWRDGRANARDMRVLDRLWESIKAEVIARASP